MPIFTFQHTGRGGMLGHGEGGLTLIFREGQMHQVFHLEDLLEENGVGTE